MLDWLKKQVGRIQEMRQQKAKEYLNDLKWRYQIFRSLLYENTRAVELITDIDLRFRETNFFGPGIRDKIRDLVEVTGDLVEKLNQLDYDRHASLFNIHKKVSNKINELLKKVPSYQDLPLCVPLSELPPQCSQFAGGKACTLARLRAEGKFHVPNGFSVLVSSCRYFLEESGLSVKILKKLQPVLFKGKEMTRELEEEIKKEVMAAELPASLEQALKNISSQFFEQGRGLAVRSSALSEDGSQHSFAGQFTSVLNVVTFEGLKEAVKEVIASNFNGRSLAYRIGAGMNALDFNMAVLCIEMVDAEKAGVIFSLDPNDRERETMLISALYGMGELVVSGASMADVYRPFRKTDGGELFAHPPVIAKKIKRLAPDPGGGLKEEDIDPDRQEKPVLSPDEVKKLVSVSLQLEKILGGPQDIEWAIDRQGTVWILQARPLILEGPSKKRIRHLEHRKSLFSESLITSRGIVTGKVKKVRSRQDLEADFDEPTVLVLHRSLVDAAKVMSKIVGLLVDFGNPADHLSCVAREYGRPMLVGLVNAMEKLEDGRWVTIDADRGKVFIAEDIEIQEAKEEFQKRSQGQKVQETAEEKDTVLEQLKELTVKLNLTDAYGPTFSIMECRSLHDIVRYVHEKAVMAFFKAGDELLEETSGVVYKLESGIPFFLQIIDMGGGLVPNLAKKRTVTPDEVVCRPFKALWKGISTPGLRWAGPPPVVGNVSSVVGRWMSDTRSQRPLGMPNYLIIARDYLNLNARMDFHFTMVDSLCGLDPRENHVKFRFKGGGTTLTQRNRRARAIGEILERADFFTDVKADLVNATFAYAPAEVIEEKLVIVGRLLGFTRLIDAAMYSDETPHLVADAFYEEDYELRKLTEIITRQKELEKEQQKEKTHA